MQLTFTYRLSFAPSAEVLLVVAWVDLLFDLV